MAKSKKVNKDVLLNNLEKAIMDLSEAESAIVEYINILDEIQLKILDIEHFLEVNKITQQGAVNIIKELQDLRIKRRDVKQLWDIWNTYGKNKEKLKEKANRLFIISELHKCDKALQTVYKNRVYEEDYLPSLNVEKAKRTKKKDLSYNNSEGEINGN